MTVNAHSVSVRGNVLTWPTAFSIYKPWVWKRFLGRSYLTSWRRLHGGPTSPFTPRRLLSTCAVYTARTSSRLQPRAIALCRFTATLMRLWCPRLEQLNRLISCFRICTPPFVSLDLSLFLFCFLKGKKKNHLIYIAVIPHRGASMAIWILVNIPLHYKSSVLQTFIISCLSVVLS